MFLTRHARPLGGLEQGLLFHVLDLANLLEILHLDQKSFAEVPTSLASCEKHFGRGRRAICEILVVCKVVW